MMLTTLEDAFLNELRDVLHAEKQLLKALPKMAKKATNSELRGGFEQHQRETEEQVRRLERAFAALGQKAKAQKCEAMEGLVKEGQEVMRAKADKPVRDALLIAAAQKVEHYEIATYGTLCAWAQQLGYAEVARLLNENLAEEKETDKKLTQLAMSINNQAKMGTGRTPQAQAG